MSHPGRYALLASILLLGSSACDDEGFSAMSDAEELHAASRKQISTSYDLETRTIYAKGEPEGTYNVLITSKTLLTGTCENYTPIMEPMPQQELEVAICGGLGLLYAVLSGGIKACVASKESNVGVPVYRFNFTSLNTQVNYNVVDVGNTGLLGSSGWQPANKNGCPRDGFPY